MCPSALLKRSRTRLGLDEDSFQSGTSKRDAEKKFLDGSRYDETVIGSCNLPLSFPAESVSSWRIRRKVKTQDIILVLCLNFDQIPEDSMYACGMGDECWINLNSLSQKKNAFRYIALTLQKQYENLLRSSSGVGLVESNNMKLHTKHLLDPSLTNVEAACEEIRASTDKATQNRVIFHYNGHGVPTPTDLGEIWVFNKRYDKYKPVPISVIHSWIKTPTLYVMDCSNAGCLLNHLMELNTDSIEDETSDVYFLGACDTLETLPVHSDFPADLFTACLTDPLRTSIRWYLHMRHVQPFNLTQDIIDEETIEEDFAYRLEGGSYDRELPRGKLRMVYDCITDCIAWNQCDLDTYKVLFKTDEMVASLFRNFLLAQRIMSFFNCHPVSKPCFQDMSGHQLWKMWDAVIEDFLRQFAQSQKRLFSMQIDTVNEIMKSDESTDPYAHIRQVPRLATGPSQGSNSSQQVHKTFTFHTTFFRSVLQELYSFICTSQHVSEIPEYFPMLAQLLNSDEMTQQVSLHESINVIELLADFAERSHDTVLAILTSINFASLKRISFRAQRHHRASLLRLWVCIISFDYRVHEDLIQNLFTFLLSFLRVDAENDSTEQDITRVEFILSIACRENDLARVKCRESGVPQLIKIYLKSGNWQLRCWTCVLLSLLCCECNDLKEYLFNDSAYNDLLKLLSDSQPEVRAAALLLLQSFVGFGYTESSVTTGNIHEYMTREDIEFMIEQRSISLLHDKDLLENVSKRILMNRECSVLVRRELLRLILKVFCQGNHLAHMICLVDRILKNKLDMDTLLNHVDNGSDRSNDHNQFYVKYWIMFLSLRDAEPHLAIRKAAGHYVNVVCKNVDNLKNSEALPVTPSIFDFSSLLQMGQHRSSMHRPASLGLPTVLPEGSLQSSASQGDLSLPLLTTSRRSHTPTSIPPITTGTTLPTISTGSGSLTPRHRSGRSSGRMNSLIPAAIATTPSFSNLQLTVQGTNTPETSSHIDSWLEVQLGLVGLPETLVEWCINGFVKHLPITSSKGSQESRTRFDETVSGNSLAEYSHLQSVAQFKPIHRVTQKDVFHTNGSDIHCLSFHPFYSTLAVGVNSTVMVYDYEEKRQIYSIDTRLDAPPTDLTWINPSSSAYLVEATQKGSVYVWDIPSLDQKREPRMISSFLAFPVFAKDRPNTASPTVVMDWSQSTGLLACAGSTQLVKVWDMNQERLVCCKETGYMTTVVSVKSHGEFMHYCGLYDGHVISMDTRCKEVSNVFEYALKPTNRVVSMTMKDENSIILGDFEGNALTIDLRVNREISSLAVTEYMSDLQVHPSLPLMVATSLDSEVVLMNDRGTKIQSIRALDGFRAASLGNLQAVAMHPLDMAIATFNLNGIVYIYNSSVCFRNSNKQANTITTATP